MSGSNKLANQCVVFFREVSFKSIDVYSLSRVNSCLNAWHSGGFSKTRYALEHGGHLTQCRFWFQSLLVFSGEGEWRRIAFFSLLTDSYCGFVLPLTALPPHPDKLVGITTISIPRLLVRLTLCISRSFRSCSFGYNRAQSLPAMLM